MERRYCSCVSSDVHSTKLGIIRCYIERFEDYTKKKCLYGGKQSSNSNGSVILLLHNCYFPSLPSKLDAEKLLLESPLITLYPASFPLGPLATFSLPCKLK